MTSTLLSEWQPTEKTGLGKNPSIGDLRSLRHSFPVLTRMLHIEEGRVCSTRLPTINTGTRWPARHRGLEMGFWELCGTADGTTCECKHANRNLLTNPPEFPVSFWGICGVYGRTGPTKDD